MPLLFFVSGFLFYKSDALTFEKVKVILNKRIQRLLIPYITTGFFVLFLKGYFGYWFFITLFVLDIIVVVELYIVENLVKRTTKDNEISIICHITVFAILYLCAKFYSVFLPIELTNFAYLPQYYLLFMLGFLLHKHPRLEAFITTKQIVFLSFIFYLTLIVVVFYFNRVIMLGILIPLFACLFLYCMAKHIFEESRKQTLTMLLGGVKIIGQHSMEIYVFHLFFVIQLPSVGDFILTVTNFPTSITLQLAYSLTISVIAIFFSIIMAKIINCNYYLSKLLFGK